jgi:hypothetical protein
LGTDLKGEKMATAMEYDVLREIASDCSGIFSRVLEEDDEEGQKDRDKLRLIYRDILNQIEPQFIDYDGVSGELVRIRDKYKKRPLSKKNIEMRARAKKEFESLKR